MKRGVWSAIAGLWIAAAVFAIDPANAEFPERAVRIIVPFPAGGVADTLARLVGKELADDWGKPVVIENKAGGFGVIGTQAVALSPADGYVIGLFPSTHAINPVLLKNLPYDTMRDFAPVGIVATAPGLLVVQPSLDAKDVNGAINLAKANPGKYNFASPGPLSAGHRSMELLKRASSTDIRHVPYKGGPPALNDLLGGQVQFMVAGVPLLMPHVIAGRLRALAVTSPQRFEGLPDVPTLAESGFPGFDSVEWYGIFAPAQTPRAVVDRLSAELDRVLRKGSMRERLVALGATPGSGGSSALRSLVEAEHSRWTRLAPAMDLKAE